MFSFPPRDRRSNNGSLTANEDATDARKNLTGGAGRSRSEVRGWGTAKLTKWFVRTCGFTGGLDGDLARQILQRVGFDKGLLTKGC